MPRQYAPDGISFYRYYFRMNYDRPHRWMRGHLKATSVCSKRSREESDEAERYDGFWSDTLLE
jgi:hypothetical protein